MDRSTGKMEQIHHHSGGFQPLSELCQAEQKKKIKKDTTDRIRLP